MTTTSSASEVSLVSTTAGAEEPAHPRWQVDVKASYVVLGAHGAHATGDLMPSITAVRSWPARDAATIRIGADLGLFGLGADAHWLGILGGPAVAVGIAPFHAPLSCELSTRLDLGRIPVCNAWGVCARFFGFFPAAELGAAYRVTPGGRRSSRGPTFSAREKRPARAR